MSLRQIDAWQATCQCEKAGPLARTATEARLRAEEIGWRAERPAGGGGSVMTCPACYADRMRREGIAEGHAQARRQHAEDLLEQARSFE